MGETELRLKFRLLNNETLPVGIALVPFATFPTGSDRSFVGNGVFTGGGTLVVETKRLADRFSLALNIGGQIREETALTSGTTIDDSLHYGLAANWAVHPKVDLIGEVRGWTLFQDLWGEAQRPLEAGGGVRLYPHRRIALTVGGFGGIFEGTGNPTYRILGGISWIPPHREYTPKPKVKELDADGDGIKNGKDRCPTEPGPKSNGGCPERPQLVISPEESRILTRPIHFAFGSADLRPGTLPILKTLAEALKSKPEIQRLSIQGHCDFIGTDEFNDWLSEERAKSVLYYLVDQGISHERLQVVGWGERRPVDPAQTAAARAKNRRVEFIFLKVEGMDLPKEIPPSDQPTLRERYPDSREQKTFPSDAAPESGTSDESAPTLENSHTEEGSEDRGIEGSE